MSLNLVEDELFIRKIRIISVNDSIPLDKFLRISRMTIPYVQVMVNAINRWNGSMLLDTVTEC